MNSRFICSLRFAARHNVRPERFHVIELLAATSNQSSKSGVYVHGDEVSVTDPVERRAL
jgi:hypothetical protein